MLIPCGKHKGKILGALADSSLLGMYGSWQGNPKLREHEFLSSIYEEIRARNLEERAAKSGKPAAAPGLNARITKEHKGKKKTRKLEAANCGCGNGVKLAVFIVENGQTLCDIECTSCRKIHGRVKYQAAVGMMRKGELYFIEPAKQPKSAQRKVDYHKEWAEQGETTSEYLELMQNIL